MYTVDELICVCISRQVKNGELVAQGMATPLVAAGYLLAKLTHAPDLTFASAIGQSVCDEWAPLGLATVEKLWVEKGRYQLDFVEIACSFLPVQQPTEFFRPGQVDPYGNFNNVYMGGTYQQPRLRLPGAAGIPDVTIFEENICLYVPRHGRHTFVSHLSFRSGLGHDDVRVAGNGPRYLVSDLGQFDFGGERGHMRLIAHHPTVSLAKIQAKTGFPFPYLDPLPETVPPSVEELRLLREVIDPLGIRTLETLRAAARRRKLSQILEQEKMTIDK